MWTDTFPLADLPHPGARVFKHGRDQVAIFHRPEGLYAVDNRCPHEGYPLVQGTVAGCTLTCIWHNYKFDLRDGACVLGEEAVRSYPVRVVDGVVQVDLRPHPAAVGALTASLDAGLVEHRMGRVVRDLVRLLDAGVPPERLALHAARFDAQRGEYGLSHAPAVAAELLVDLRRHPGLDAALPLALVFDLAGRSNVRRPLRPVPAAVDPGDDPIAAGRRHADAVEAEDAHTAEGLIRGAVARGWRRAELEPWLLQICAAHFLDFGHLLLYAVKVLDLLDGVDWDGAADLLGAWTFGAVHATREDLLPAWAGFRARGPLPTGDAALDADALVDASPRDAAAILAGVRDDAALRALAVAASERLLRFDVTVDRDPTVQEGWLDVTHRLTVVNATRHALARGGDRRLLALCAQFVAMARPLDGPRERIVPDDGDLEAACVAHDTARAVGIVADRHARGLDLTPLRDLALRDLHTRAIFAGHDVKTVGAALEEAAFIGDVRPVLGAVRYLAGRAQERTVARLVHEALALVRDGRPPTTRT